MRRNILIVDDDEQIGKLMGLFLEQAGYIIKVAKDGYTCLHELENNHYDLVILDLSMPHYNGFHVLRSVRSSQRHADIPILILTSSETLDNIQRAKEFGVSDYVIKPPRKQDILLRVERLVESGPKLDEFYLNPEDEEGRGAFCMPVELVSITPNGMVLSCPVPLQKQMALADLSVHLLKKLGVPGKGFKVTDCTPVEQGGFEIFVSFLDLPLDQQRRIQDWLAQHKGRRPVSRRLVA